MNLIFKTPKYLNKEDLIIIKDVNARKIIVKLNNVNVFYKGLSVLKNVNVWNVQMESKKQILRMESKKQMLRLEKIMQLL